MSLRPMAFTVVLLAAAPVLAGRELTLDLSPNQAVADTARAKPKSATTAAAASPNKPAAPSTAPTAPVVAAPPAKAAAPATPPAAPGPAAAPSAKVSANSNELPLTDIPAFEDVDAKLLKDVSLCIFPFIKEDKVADAAGVKSSGQNLERIQKIFSDVAHSAPLLKDTITLGKDAPICGIEDVTCIAALGGFTGCQAVIAGRATREDNGFTLRARMVDAKKGKLIAKVNQVVATADESEMAAWAEGQACRALKVNCSAVEQLDADRADMKVLVDNKPIDRKPGIVPGKPEQLSLMPGVYKIRATIGQRTSRELTLAVRRNQPDTIYVRQTADGGIPVMLKSELKPGDIPAPSIEFRNGMKPTRVVGLVSAGLGVIAGAVAIQQFSHSQSLANQAANDYANNGYYKPSDVTSISSARTAHTTSIALSAVGAGLVVLGGVLYFAF